MNELANKTRSEVIGMLVTARDNAYRLPRVRLNYKKFVNSLLAKNEQETNLNANVEQATKSMTRAQIVSNLESHLNQMNNMTAAGKGAP